MKIERKIREKDMKADTKHIVMLRHFLRNPEKMWKYLRLLYLSNVIAHIQDSLLQEFDSFAPYMNDQSINQRMKNANNAFSRMVDAMYLATKEMWHHGNVDDKYCQVVNVAIKVTPIIDQLVNDCAWHGLNEFRYVELEKTMKKLITQESIDREIADFAESLKVEYKDEYEAYDKIDADETKRKFTDALENMILTNHTK